MQTRSNDENSVCLSVRPSVCLSDKSVICDKTKESCASILIPHEGIIALVAVAVAVAVDAFKYNFPNRIIGVWNELPDCVVKASTCFIFRRLVDGLDLQKYCLVCD